MKGEGTTGVYGTSSGGTGVTGESASASGFGVYAANTNGAALRVDGSATQLRDKGGLVKAMVAITAAGDIARCYNGVTGSTTVPCGITVTPANGIFFVDFPFQVSDRFWMAIPEFDAVNVGVTSLSFNQRLHVTVSRTERAAIHLFVF